MLFVLSVFLVKFFLRCYGKYFAILPLCKKGGEFDYAFVLNHDFNKIFKIDKI